MEFKLKEYRLKRIADKELLEDLKRVAGSTGVKAVTTRQYMEHGKYHYQVLSRRFGCWIDALELAGLERTKHYRISYEDLYDNLKKVWVSLRRVPARMDMKKPLSKYSAS